MLIWAERIIAHRLHTMMVESLKENRGLMSSAKTSNVDQKAIDIRQNRYTSHTDNKATSAGTEDQHTSQDSAQDTVRYVGDVAS